MDLPGHMGPSTLALIHGLILFYGFVAFLAFAAGLWRIGDWRAFRRRRERDDRRERSTGRPASTGFGPSRPDPRPPVRLPDGNLPGGAIPGVVFRPAPPTMPEPASLPSSPKAQRHRGSAPFARRRVRPE